MVDTEDIGGDSNDGCGKCLLTMGDTEEIGEDSNDGIDMPMAAVSVCSHLWIQRILEGIPMMA